MIEYEKANTKSSKQGLAVYDIGVSKAKNLIDIELNEIYDYNDENPQDIMSVITDVIHNIPRLFTSVELDHLQIYLGKTTLSNLHNRAEDHWANAKDTPYFIPILKVSKKDINFVEKLGLRYLFFLEDNNFLCFGKLLNQKEGGGGRASNDKEQIIYLTFRTDKRNKSNLLPKDEIDLATGFLYYNLIKELKDEINPQIIRETLNEISKMKGSINLFWSAESR